MVIEIVRLGKRAAWIGLCMALLAIGISRSEAQDSQIRTLRQHTQILRYPVHLTYAPANMLEAIEQDSNLKGFAELLQIAGLQNYVKTAPITVFAPQDPACAPLLKQAREWRKQNNAAKLAGLRTSVKHHLLSGKYMWRPGAQNDVKQLQGDTLEMASGFRLAIYPTNTGSSFTLQVSNSRRARVLRSDIIEPNGVLFVIDRQLDAHSVRID